MPEDEYPGLDCQSVGRNISLPIWMWSLFGKMASDDPSGAKLSQVIRGRLLTLPECQERIAQALGGGSRNV